jgi:Domain of unknown function (DUF4112)
MTQRHKDSPPHLSMERLNRFAWLLDNSIPIPGTRYRIGLDPLIGLIPGIGDTIAALLSMIIIGEAARARLPASILARMTFNVALEVLIGAIPLIGDIFDMTWKANARNASLMERYLTSSRSTVVSSRIMLSLVAAFLFFSVVASLWVGFMILHRLWTAISG